MANTTKLSFITKLLQEQSHKLANLVLQDVLVVNITLLDPSFK